MSDDEDYVYEDDEYDQSGGSGDDEDADNVPPKAIGNLVRSFSGNGQVNVVVVVVDPTRTH